MSVTTAVVAARAHRTLRITALPSRSSWPRPSSPAAAVSSVPTSCGRSRRVATICACSCAAGRASTTSPTSRSSGPAGTCSTGATVRAAMEDVERVFHLAGTTSMRPQDRDRVFELNMKGTRIVLEEALAAGVGRVVHASSVAAIGPAKPGGTADEDQPFRAGELGHRLRQLQARGRGRGAEARRARARRGDRQPVVRARPGRSERDLHGARAPLPAGAHPGLRRRSAQHRRRARRRPGLPARRREGERGERYILGGRNFTLDRLFADFARISGREPPVRVPARPTTLAVDADRAGRPADRCLAGRGPLGEAVVDLSQHEGTARARVSSRGRTRRRSRMRCDGRWTSSATACEPAAGPAGGGARGRRAAAAAGRTGAGPVIVLYRCPTRTNVLCPCGAVARRLGSWASSTGPSGSLPAFGPPRDRGADAATRVSRCWSTATR